MRRPQLGLWLEKRLLRDEDQRLAALSSAYTAANNRNGSHRHSNQQTQQGVTGIVLANGGATLQDGGGTGRQLAEGGEGAGVTSEIGNGTAGTGAAGGGAGGGDEDSDAPPLGGGPAGMVLRAAYAELIHREPAKANAQRLPARLWATHCAEVRACVRTSE